MQTQYFNAVTQKENGVRLAGSIIRSGGLVAFPTETVYGLGANGLDPAAVEGIFRAKGRPSDNPLILHVAKKSDVKDLWTRVPEEARLLMDAFWPGPLTLIFNRSSLVPDQVAAGLPTVAVRMPDHKTALALIRAAGVPIAAPSANLSGRPSPTTAQHVKADLDGRIDLVLDGGPCRVGLESTVLSLCGEPTILRPGGVTREMLEAVMGSVQVSSAVLAPLKGDGAAPSPGMKYKHYAPRADMVIVAGEEDRVVTKINELAAAAGEAGRRVGIICTDETKLRYHADNVVSIGARTDEDAIAQHLYKILRDFDDTDTEVIYSESFATPRIGQAIMNRLLKAAGHQVISV